MSLRPIVSALAALAFLAAPARLLAQVPAGAGAGASAGRAAGSVKVAPGAASEKVPEKQLITLDFQDVEIGVLVRFMSEITGKNFILDEKIRGKVTVISPTKITIEEAYRVFQSILDVKGFTTLPAGPVTKIVPVRDAKESGAPLSPRSARGDEFITQLVPLTYTEASTLAPVLQPMVSKDGLISAYDPANTLLLIDTASNIERLLGIISELDIEAPERGMEVIHLENAYAQNVAQTIQQVLESQNETGVKPGGAPPPAARPAGQPVAAGSTVGTAATPFKVIPDERTNSVIALASSSQMRMIRALVKDLDKKLDGVSKINVYPLKYANAVEMVGVLSELIGGGNSRAGGGGALAGGGTSSRRTTRQQQQRGGGLGGSRNLAGGLGGNALGGGSANAQGGNSAGAPVSATGSGGEFVGDVRITADPYTNSLLVSAGPQDLDVLKRVIEELDVPRRQVYVEAIILEVSLDKSRQLGFEFQGGASLGDKGIGLGRLNLNNLNTALTSPQSLSGLVLAAASNQTITLPNGTQVPAQVALFNAIQSDSDVNILSAPNILTSDNQEAEILVGQNIPFIASRATDSTNLSNTFATVERQDVGITLRLTPQISQGDVVRLDIYEEVSAVVPNPPVNADIAGPTTTIRSASTTIVARSGQTVVLGGLISDNVSNSTSKLPFVGDIPVLGQLFKNTDDRKNKINLLIFLTPHVVHDEAELAGLSLEQRDRFKKGLREQQTGPRRREQLEAPSWNAPRRPATSSLPRTYVPPPATPFRAPAYESAPEPPRVAVTPRAFERAPQPSSPITPSYPISPANPILPSSPGALGIPSTGHRFAVLLTLFEKGDEPPELQTSNGFLTVYTPVDGGEFFVKGAGYEYKSAAFEARYTCLEVFPDAATALSVYPEGRSLERWGGAVVRWKPISTDRLRAMVAGNSPWKRTR